MPAIAAAIWAAVCCALGTFAAWNAAIYVAQVDDERLKEAVRDGRYIEATQEVLQRHGGLWFNDESYVISRPAKAA